MATLESLQFEMERRVILFKPTTTMPDLSQLGYNADPNLIVTPITPGEQLLYNCPVDTRYAQLDASQNVIQEWFKKAMQNTWLHLGSGSDSSIRGAMNIGDGSVGVYAGLSVDGSLQFKKFIGAGAATLTETADLITIKIDGSFGGEINYGLNVGTGDASIYYDKLGNALRFREIKAGTGLAVSVSDNLVIIASTATPGSGLDGGVWITNIAPNGGGNVGDKVYSSGGAVLDSCLTDTSSLTVSVLALPGHTNYRPYVYINNVSINISASVDKPVFTGTYNMQYNFADASITVVHEDGAYWSTRVAADIPAVISSANFIGTYPGSQTELKAGDTMQINVVTDVSIVQVLWDNTGALTAGTYTASGTNNTFTVTIADRGTSLQSLGFTLRVKKATGSTSLDYVSTVHGSVDLVDVVKCNNLYPTAVFGTITYPASQGAIKTSEDASVANNLANYDTITYSSPNLELSIANPTVAANPKIVSYSSGTYNVGTNNLRMVANRIANNSTTTTNTLVKIADTAATLSVSNPASRLRSGGNDGTAVQNHTITITANQELYAAPTLVKDTGGTWSGGGFAGGPSVWTRTLQVSDNDSKATYNWGAISGTNLAGRVTTTNSGSTQYILGGFVVRTITLAAFGWQANIGVAVADYSKLSSSGSGQVLAWTVLQNTRSTLGDVTRPQASVWSASATGTNPTTINILDKSATDSQSQATTFTIQEAV